MMKFTERNSFPSWTNERVFLHPLGAIAAARVDVPSPDPSTMSALSNTTRVTRLYRCAAARVVSILARDAIGFPRG